MAEELVDTTGIPESSIVETKIGGDENFHSPSSAARALANYRYEKLKKEQPEVSADDATPAIESAPADAEPPKEIIGETKVDEATANAEPPIDPPGSWTREAKERWKSLPRETQEYLAERERQREREFTKGQQEAAELRKAAEAERAKAEQARQQFEAALPQQVTAAQAILALQFPDIRTTADVDRLSTEDPYRFSQWQWAQQKLAVAQQEAFAAEQRAAEEKRTKFAEFAAKQDKAFREAIPDAADPVKASEIEKKALKTLSDLGFEQAELAKAWAGQEEISLRDSRMQQLIHKAALWDDAQAKAAQAKAKAAEKPVPPVQRPGVSKSPGAQAEAETQALTQRLAQTGSLRDAVALRLAQRAAR